MTAIGGIGGIYQSQNNEITLEGSNGELIEVTVDPNQE